MPQISDGYLLTFAGERGEVRGSRVELLARLEIGFLCGGIQHEVHTAEVHEKSKETEIFVLVHPANPFLCDLNLFECVNFHCKIFASLSIKVLSLSCRDVTRNFEVACHPAQPQPSPATRGHGEHEF